VRKEVEAQFTETFAPIDHPDEIRRKDPWLSGTGKPAAWRERVMSFWAGPLRRYIPRPGTTCWCRPCVPR
jgi:hypothetical protein